MRNHFNFYIQANNPRVLKEHDLEDKNISDAMETIFPLYTESAVMMWNHICVPLSYKYDISYMMDDMLKQQYNRIPNNGILYKGH